MKEKIHRFALYALSEDGEHFRYIGITNRPNGPRLCERRNNGYRKSNPELVAWLDDLKARKAKPKITILARLEVDHGPPYIMASALEKFAISYYATKPRDNRALFNKSCNPLHTGKAIKVLSSS